jgi:predicted transcriptional regulator
MKKADLSSVSRPEILDSIKDDKSLRLLNSIAKGEESDTEGPSIPLNISRKEYYLRMSKFVKTGIVTRRQGKYVLTSFGKIIYELQLLLVEAIDMNLRTVESFTPDLF